jgi:flagellar M-ring protein FliF
MGGLLQTLRNLGPARLGLMGAVMVGMLIFFFFLTTRMSSGQMGLLYSDLPTSDSAAIVAKLDAMQVPYQVSADGNQIKVPVEQVGKLRMAMAADGIPSGGGVGYEIFDKQNSFGTTSFVQNINQLRALEGELGRTIASMEGVRAARVNLVLPQRELFAKETQPATASIFLTLRGSTTMTREQIAAIQHLVAAAVPMLKPQAISIVDNAGNLLARGRSDGGDSATGGDQTGDDVRHEFETRMQNQIEDLLGRTVGYGHVRATVTADMDFNRVVTNEEKYDPEGQVARSTQTVTDKSSSSDNGGNGGSVSVANNLPAGQGGAAAGAAAGGGSGSNNNHTEETTNYEIGKKVTNSVQEVGAVKKLSVAVLIDGTYTADEKDKTKQTYAPRSKEDMASYEDLVKSAIGFDDKRGDSFKIENMQFAHDAEAAPEQTLPLGFTKEDLTKLLETVVLGLVAIMFILLVVKPLTTRVMATVPVPAPSGGGGGFAAPTNAMLTDQSGGGTPQLGGPMYNSEQLAERMINLEQVEGRVRASSLKKISEIVDKHPEQAVSILRQWLYQDPAR